MNVILKSVAQAAGVDAADMQAALDHASAGGISPALALVESGAVDERQFSRHLAEHLRWQWLESPQPHPDEAAELKRLIPARFAVRHQIYPVGFTNDEPQSQRRLLLACHDPFDLITKQAVARVSQLPVKWCLTPRTELLNAVQQLYGVGADTFDALIAAGGGGTDDQHLRDEANVIDDEDEDASVVKFVNQIIREALAQKATDIHVEPQPDSLRIRYRIDGFLHEVPVPENIKSLQSSVIARIKVMSKLDIAEKRLPQDGRINLKADNQSIDVRVACIPSVEGESISLRLLGQERFTLDRLGLSDELRERIEVLLAKPNGIVLVTGPTGSGKSTTLYTFLSQLNSVHRRIVTIEDPVENKLPGIVQIPVKSEIGLTFASGLRSILRGDPNVVMVGEIRDLETAEIAVRASLTGHLVFSTLHTNDAVAGITRLIEMGVKPFLVSSAVRAFIAQRLVRCLCSACKEPANYKREDFLKLGFPEAKNLKLYRAARGGCQQCRGTGYSGRVALYEIALMTPTMQTLVSERASEADLQTQARKDGFVPMREYGLKKAAAGVTTLEEVARVTSEEFE
ncbi:GspE/PulE family protein [Prosthecobacter vanneervenii]|uniref:Type II secretory ATPase GspE/PulE/Tfp pilus assembly ATPase PilB-like protein n=1 Tax=Prosthecobacter vanneervenii TaxID=48466 RepID=A0A7W7Y7N6_9BACT|nr:GspE/PulE family protein [Prosthecobacter vanneervenii]MBB5030942.1 type II secretory ATPase GspE/PulE/Tfp pilus assembly ATPase PilB-like protein [Prosthecobacter vanneervenii]